MHPWPPAANGKPAKCSISSATCSTPATTHSTHLSISQPRGETVGRRGHQVWWGWSTGGWRREQGGDGHCWDTSAWDWKHQGGAWTYWITESSHSEHDTCNRTHDCHQTLQFATENPPPPSLPLFCTHTQAMTAKQARAWCRMHMPDQWSLMHPPCAFFDGGKVVLPSSHSFLFPGKMPQWSACRQSTITALFSS
jgi:hypothetical protein